MDADKIKQFFVLHVEKMIVSVVVIFSLFLIYQGLQLEDFRREANKQPDELEADAKQVRNQVDDDKSEAIIPERVPTFNIVARTNASQRPVDYTAYRLRHTWELEDIDSTIRREDPTILAPRDLIVRSFVGSIAVRSRTGDYPLTELEDAERPEKVEEPRPRESRRGRRGRGRGGDEYSDYADEAGMGYEDFGAGMGSEMGMGGPSMAGVGPKWRLPETMNFGIKPAKVQNFRNASVQEEPVPAAASFIVGTAVVPHREMVQSFKRALKDADGYNPARDLPRYFEFEVQRADVTDRAVDDLTDEDWVLRGSRKKYAFEAATKWAGFCPEVLPKEFRDEALTTYIPPILIDDYRRITGHPKIPETFSRFAAMEEEIDDSPVSLEDIRLAGPSGGRGRGMEMGMGMGMGGEMDMYGGYDAGGAMDMYGGMGGGYGMGMSGGYGSMAMEEDPVDHKLIRFYDFADARDAQAPKLGHLYVYRLRVSLIDPNFPREESMQPDAGVLSADVYARILPLLEKARADKKRGEGSYQRWSEWSRPSAAAGLGGGEEVFAGPFNPGRRFRVEVGGRTIEYERDAPTAQAVLADMNADYGVRVPFRVDITEGSVLSAKGTTEVIDPITMAVKTLPDAKAQSGSTVIDLDGGQPLGIFEGDHMTEPGMMLLYDATTGRLKVSGELAEQRRYRVYSFADDRGL